ncbi:chemosensory receptor a [Plakobranchus ocellatus]|uniref:Chemosensory receptor a n=1 Tax=Plakobranchus ocellatus TaxID=259542 RepID=A0AAV3ZWI3_9GAST|nr:chemosensory receptor a [Plakobranchus ocellatus]
MSQGSTNYTNSPGSNADQAEITYGFVAPDWKDLDEILIYPTVPILFFSLLGIITNMINILVFVKMGIRDTTTVSMLALAVSDFLCCSLSLWTYLCFTPAFRDLPNLSFRPTEVAIETGTNFRPYMTRTGALITAFITLERCLCVVRPMKVRNIITLKMTRITIVVVYAVTILPFVAHPLHTTLGWKFDPDLNKTLLGAVRINLPISAILIQINAILCGFIYLLLASIIIVVCTLFLVISLVRSSRWRDAVRNQTQAPHGKTLDLNSNRPSKEIRLIKIVVAIALLFIICHLPGTIVIFIFPVTLNYIEQGRFYQSSILLQGFLFAFEVVNNSVNFFIYYSMGTKFRVVFRQLLGLKETKT